MVRGRVDSERQPAHDRRVGLGQFGGKRLSEVEPVTGRVARAD